MSIEEVLPSTMDDLHAFRLKEIDRVLSGGLTDFRSLNKNGWRKRAIFGAFAIYSSFLGSLMPARYRNPDYLYGYLYENHLYRFQIKRHFDGKPFPLNLDDFYKINKDLKVKGKRKDPCFTPRTDFQGKNGPYKMHPRINIDSIQEVDINIIEFWEEFVSNFAEQACTEAAEEVKSLTNAFKAILELRDSDENIHLVFREDFPKQHLYFVFPSRPESVETQQYSILFHVVKNYRSKKIIDDEKMSDSSTNSDEESDFAEDSREAEIKEGNHSSRSSSSGEEYFYSRKKDLEQGSKNTNLSEGHIELKEIKKEK